VKTLLPIAHCQLPIGEPPALAARPARSPRASRFTLHAFTLIEILVAISLLSFIVLGLFAMFNQTQRAFRLSMTQSDILEAGRAVTEMIPRELEQAAASYGNATNFSVTMIPSSSPLPPLTQSLPGTTIVRTNLLQDCFLLLHQNQTWIGIGYCVRTIDSTGHLWLPEVFPGQLGAGSLYRFTTNCAMLDPKTGLRQGPSQFYRTFLNACAPGALASTNIARICDGVVHFRLRAFATNGFPLFSDKFHTNACFYFYTNSATKTFLSESVVRQTRVAWNDRYPDNLAGLYLWSNAVPATVEMELGLLEQYTWERYNSIGNSAARLAYLQRDDTSSRVHLFRQRIPIRNVDPLPYQ
jgi:type II secretory pathway pseudopilin PulG